MKKIILYLYLLLILPGCNFTNQTSQSSEFVTIGSQNPSQTWIYLCGLVHNFNPDQMNELKVLDTIGRELNIKILAIIPHQRCAEYNNFLCWPHNDKNKLVDTYQEIMKTIDTEVDGYIGFSNGGFFLMQLAQYMPFNKPIIIIGAAGKINNTQGPSNKINLLIGQQDQWHYEHAINLYNQSKNTNLTIDLIEYSSGHEIPVNTLKDVLKRFL